MKTYDSRCIANTVRLYTAVPQAVHIKHIVGCRCEPDITIEMRRAIVINASTQPNTMCPCGEPRHMGMCKDAILAGQGRVAPKWKAQ